MKKFKLMSALLASALLFTACGSQKPAESSASEASAAGMSQQASEQMSEKMSEQASSTEKSAMEAKLLRGYAAPHGEKSFARVGVVVSGEKIVAVTLDEFQYGDLQSGNTFLPLATAEGATVNLFSKNLNDESYSKHMTEKAKSTQTRMASLKAIYDFAMGKTVAELEEALSKAEAGKPMDAISSSTLVDTQGYVKAIVDTVKMPVSTTTMRVESVDGLKIGAMQDAAHGTKSAADILVVVSGDKVVGANLDEFQYLPKGDKVMGVPNSDKKFAESYPEGQVLASKIVNNEFYSALMTEKAKATKTWMASAEAIQAYAAGKTVAELEKLVSENEAGKPVDAISESTFVDTLGYVKAIVNTAKAAK